MASINQHSPLRCLLMEAWIHCNESVRNPVWISCELKKKNIQGACSSPRLQYLRDYGFLPLLITNPWISLCHSQFYVLHWHSSSLLYWSRANYRHLLFVFVRLFLYYPIHPFKYQIILNVTLRLAFHGNNFHFPVHAHIRDTL